MDTYSISESIQILKKLHLFLRLQGEIQKVDITTRSVTKENVATNPEKKAASI